MTELKDAPSGLENRTTAGPEDDEHLPLTAAATSPQRPWPLRLLSEKLRAYLERAPAAWVEGEVLELNRRAKMSYLTISDLEAEASLNVAIPHAVLEATPTPVDKGTRVVARLKPGFWVRTGRLSIIAQGLQPVGAGDLLARIDLLRQRLIAEGLCAPERKRPLPVLPELVGLVTGKNSDAMKDVIRNAHLRWPGVQFLVREVAVQGTECVHQVLGALQELEEHPRVDVIVVARGGGSLEDLLGFSNETLVRAVAAMSTPVVSAIGHEADRPLLDDVADVRASTPTDAAKRIVPDLEQELALMTASRVTLSRAIGQTIGRERDRLELLQNRRMFTDSGWLLSGHWELLERARQQCGSTMRRWVGRQQDQVEHLQQQMRALSPQKTLERGYAIVQDNQGAVVTGPDQCPAGTALAIRVAHGAIGALSQGGELDAVKPA